MIDAPRVVNVVILDMDNTLYDWVGYFVPAIRAMLSEAAHLLNVDEARLKEDLRAVNVSHGNTEQPFALLETRVVLERLPRLNRRGRHDFLAPAFDAFNNVRKERLQLYPSVRETLQVIKATGCRLFGHTEATAVNISSRVRALGLNDFLEEVYALRFEGMPHPLADDRREPRARSDVRIVATTDRKPDPGSIKAILAETGARASCCLYVGDSLAKDITMAKHAGVLAAWARYGVSHDQQLWRDLVEISHWDPSAVAAVESASAASSAIEPDVIVDSFIELLQHFTFDASA